ncbi:MAG: hypothetical protein JO368_10780 [Acidimicrobiales bacterium]|nr:hypothetical protein [Acidimicrobiales bacterium]
MTDSEIWSTWRTLMEGALDPIEVLRVAARYERYFEEVQRQATAVAQAEGRSWQEIGEAVGISRQAAWQRFREGPGRVTGRGAADRGAVDVELPRSPADVFAPMVTTIVDSILWDDAPMRDELLDVGYRALVDAVTAHAASPRKMPFTVYASARIRQAVTDGFLEALDRQRRLG